MYITHSLKKAVEKKKSQSRISSILIQNKISRFIEDHEMETLTRRQTRVNTSFDKKQTSTPFPLLRSSKPKLSKFAQKYKNKMNVFSDTTFQHRNQQIEKKPYDLGKQNYRKLSNFIKGAYHPDQHQYSDYVNLEQVERTRRDFITFNKIYEGVSKKNPKEEGKDLSSMYSVVYLNENKDRYSRQQMKNMRIIKQ